jgi:cellulase
MLNVPLPSQLATGEYLLRHELLMLHVAQSSGGAEWYPGCAQIKITSGVDGAAPDPTVSMTAAYSDSDPGILVPTVGFHEFG